LATPRLDRPASCTCPSLVPPAAFHHAVYFHALDLLDEYLRPARLRRGGRDETVDPLSETTRWADAEAGALEAAPSDGLRSLLTSFPDVPEMEELTLRVPGHLDVMRQLRDLGLLDAAALPGTATSLERRFPGADHPDRVLLEVHAERGDETRAYRVHVQHGDGLTAMSRATAFTAAAGAVVLAERGFDVPGVHAPEALGADATEVVLAELASNGIRVGRGARLRPAWPPRSAVVEVCEPRVRDATEGPGAPSHRPPPVPPARTRRRGPPGGRWAASGWSRWPR
jgi:lysine 6-dehydrogenase